MLNICRFAKWLETPLRLLAKTRYVFSHVVTFQSHI